MYIAVRSIYESQASSITNTRALISKMSPQKLKPQPPHTRTHTFTQMGRDRNENCQPLDNAVGILQQYKQHFEGETIEYTNVRILYIF